MGIAKKFLSFVEIRTKLASVIPFSAALAYSFYLTDRINLHGSLIYFVAAMLFDMPVTAINNYLDNREARTAQHFSHSVSLAIIFAMLVPAGVLGLYIAFTYGLAVLFAGVFCFVAGIAYTFGPAPISKSPYGEAVSGFVQGFLIMFIVVSINTPDLHLTNIYIENLVLRIDFHVPNMLTLGLVSLPAVCCISNIMLANNTCDLEADKNTRYTMARHIGRKNSLRLFAGIYIVAYLSILASVILRAVPILCLASLATIWPVQANVRIFFREQVKPETFSLSIKNFLLIMLPFILTMFLGAILERG
ncbi:MAG: UbiA family prenyltransferase [Treponema sp.]|nr:UbiA family prenyltransferase [Treponema sp.]